MLMAELDLSFKRSHHRPYVLLHAVVKSVFFVVLVLQFESHIKFFQRLENFLPTVEDADPNAAGEFVVHVLVKLESVKDPFLYLVFLHKATDDTHSVFKVVVDFFLGEPNIVGIIRIARVEMIILLLIICKYFIHVFLNNIASIIEIDAEWREHFYHRRTIFRIVSSQLRFYQFIELSKIELFQLRSNENIDIFLVNRHVEIFGHSRS